MYRAEFAKNDTINAKSSPTRTYKPSETFPKYFAQRTHFHGFAELYEGKSRISRLVWTIFILAALTISTYQIYKSILHFEASPVHTVVEFLGDRQAVRPPITFCFPFWINWIDWDKVLELNVTKNELLYSMSFISMTYSSSHWDVNETAESFDKKMKLHNFTSLEQFYFSITKNDTGTQ